MSAADEFAKEIASNIVDDNKNYSFDFEVLF